MATIVFAIADDFCFGGVTTKGFERERDVFYETRGEGLVAINLRIGEVGEFPLGVVF